MSRNMQRHSVASFPFIITPGSSEDRPSILELLNPSRDSVACSGMSAQLHSRSNGSETTSVDSPRRISVSYQSMLVAPPQIKRRMSSPATSNTSFTRQEKLDEDNDSLNSRRSITEGDDGNSNNTRSEIPANQNTRKESEDPNKLPQIVVTTSGQNEKSGKNKKRRKKNVSKDTKDESGMDAISELDEDLNDKTTNNDESTQNSDSSSIDSKADEDDWKYRLEVKHFQREWEMTRPYTYSYFPKLQSKKRKKPGTKKKQTKGRCQADKQADQPKDTVT